MSHYGCECARVISQGRYQIRMAYTNLWSWPRLGLDRLHSLWFSARRGPRDRRFLQTPIGTAAAHEHTFILWHDRNLQPWQHTKRTRQSAPPSWTTAVNLKNSQRKPLKIEQIILIYSLFSTVTSIIKIVATLFFEIIISPSFFFFLSTRQWVRLKLSLRRHCSFQVKVFFFFFSLLNISTGQKSQMFNKHLGTKP